MIVEKRKTVRIKLMPVVMISLLLACVLTACLTACGSAPAPEEIDGNEPDNVETTESKDMTDLKMEIDGTEVAVVWEENESVAALKEMALDAPVTVEMSMYGGFEQVGSLGTALPRDDKQTRTSAGDIVLYSGDQIVVFYGSNTWAYTRLGRVDLSAKEMSELLGSSDVTITLSAE